MTLEMPDGKEMTLETPYGVHGGKEMPDALLASIPPCQHCFMALLQR